MGTRKRVSEYSNRNTYIPPLIMEKNIRTNFYGEPLRYGPECAETLEKDQAFNMSREGVGQYLIENGLVAPCAHDPYTSYYYLPPIIPETSYY